MRSLTGSTSSPWKNKQQLDITKIIKAAADKIRNYELTIEIVKE